MAIQKRWGVTITAGKEHIRTERFVTKEEALNWAHEVDTLLKIEVTQRKVTDVPVDPNEP